MNKFSRLSIGILSLGILLLARPLTAQWTLLGLEGKSVIALAADSAGTIWAGTDFEGAFQSNDAGGSWAALRSDNFSLGSFSALALDTESSTLFAGTSTAVLGRPTGGAGSWSKLLESQANALAVDPTTGTVYAGGYEVSRSDDGGLIWTSSYSPARRIYALLADSLHPSTVYAGADYDYIPGYYPGYDAPLVRRGGAVIVSHDAGLQWHFSPDLGSSVIAFAQDPFTGSVVAATRDRLLSSADVGATWSPIVAEGLPMAGLAALVFDPVREGTLYAATEGGIFRSQDRGAHFEPFRAGLPAVPVLALSIDKSGGLLRAGLHTYGVWALDLNAALPCEADAETLCLLGGRFRVQASVTHPSNGAVVPGRAVPSEDAVGSFSLPDLTGDPSLPEIVVKMVDASGPPWNAFWVFYGSLTSLPYTITVTDTRSGLQEHYTGSGACGGADTASFRAGDGDSGGSTVSLAAASPRTGSLGALSLSDGRFQVSLRATDRNGGSADGVPVVLSPVSGYFSLPAITGSPLLPEVWVKVVDARALDGHFWFFYASLTNVSYALTLVETATGAARTYVGPGGTGAYCGGVDTALPNLTAPPPSRQAPSPVDISGAWTGTFATDDSADCGPEMVPVQMQFSQDGSSFTAHLPNMPCGTMGQLTGQIGTFDGVDGGFQASGFLIGGSSNSASFSGTVLPSRIRLTIQDLLVPLGGGMMEVHPGGTLELTR